MSSAKLSEIMGRIKLATEDSQIAVFKSPIADELDAIYYSTVEAHRRIHEGKPELVGVYHHKMQRPVLVGTRKTRTELNNAL